MILIKRDYVIDQIIIGGRISLVPSEFIIAIMGEEMMKTVDI